MSLISGFIKNSLNFISAFAFSLVPCHTSCILWKTLSTYYHELTFGLKYPMKFLLPPGVSGPLFPNCLCVGKRKHKSYHHWVKQNFPCV